MLRCATDDPLVSWVVARTAAKNIASQRVLERNNFIQFNIDFDDGDGEMIIWRRALHGISVQ